ncbi:MAG: DoxX family membrane protein [Pedobacter sp.]|nr:DoxX family membrane protein [Pedobacter sp.]
MKQLYNTNFNHSALNFMFFVLRVTIGLLMLTHGYDKLQSALAGGEIQFIDPFGLGKAASLYLAIFAEVFCSILLVLGFATRLASIPLIVTMLIAVLVAHGSDPFGKKELALHYLVVYVLILVCGAGKYSIDYFISRKLSKRRR